MAKGMQSQSRGTKEWAACSTDAPMTTGVEHRLDVILDDEEANEMLMWAWNATEAGHSPVASRLANKILNGRVWFERRPKT